MSRRSNILRLPPAVRQALDIELERTGFGDFERIADEFSSRGWKVSKSSLHRYAQKKREISLRAAVEVEILRHLDPAARFLVDWARREPEAAARLIKSLQKKRTTATRWNQ